MIGVAEYKSLNYLEEQGVKIVPMKSVGNLNEAGEFADKIEYPVVLKANVQDLFHKSELGVVKVNITDYKMLKKAWWEIEESVSQAGKKLDGMLVQKMISGVEVIIGATYEEQFGPTVMVGAGGIYTEVFKDITFRLAPITSDEAYRMLSELKIFKILQGARGKGPMFIKGLQDIIVKVSELIIDSSISEIDLNPVIVSEHDAVVVDALIIKRY